MSNNDKNAVNVNDKKVIGGKGNINQLMPLKYPWAFDMWQESINDRWTPNEINMSADINCFNDELNAQEKETYLNTIGWLSTADILAARNVSLAYLSEITAPEIELVVINQAADETVHCYIKGTEVLTEVGFIPFESVTPQTVITQYDPKTRQFKNVGHSGVTNDPFDGELIKLYDDDHGTIRIVTPDHRCLINDTDDVTDARIVKAHKLGTDPFSIINAPLPPKVDKKITIRPINRISMLGYMLKPIVYYANSGCRILVFGKNVPLNKTTSKHIHEAFADFNELLRPEDHYRVHEFEKDTPEWNIVVSVGRDVIPPPSVLLNSLIPGTHSHALAVLNYLEDLNDGSNVFDATNETSTRVLSAIGVTAGRSVYTKDNKVYLKPDDYQTKLGDVAPIPFKYKGRVYSVGVPSGVIVTRYNGNVSICGNTVAYQIAIETIGLDPHDVYNRYRTVPQIAAKADFIKMMVDGMVDPKSYLLSYIFFAGIFEGSWFYTGFTPMFAFNRINKMIGTGEQFEYILRDEIRHSSTGIRICKQIMVEYPELTPSRKEIKELWEHCEVLEKAYIEHIMPEPIGDYTHEDYMDNYRIVANRRLVQLGFDPVFDTGNKVISPWLDNLAYANKHKNFFETRVTEYRLGTQLFPPAKDNDEGEADDDYFT